MIPKPRLFFTKGKTVKLQTKIFWIVANSHHRHHYQAHRAYNPSHTSHYSDGVTSAPGTMNHPCGGRQRSAGYEDMHQCSLPKPVSTGTEFKGTINPLLVYVAMHAASTKIQWRETEFHM